MHKDTFLYILSLSHLNKLLFVRQCSLTSDLIKCGRVTALWLLVTNRTIKPFNVRAEHLLQVTEGINQTVRSICFDK